MKHQWVASCVQIMDSGWCRICDKKPTRDVQQRLKDVQDWAKGLSMVCISTAYHGNKEKLHFKCKQGHLFQRSYNKIFSRKAECCPDCLKSAPLFSEKAFDEYVALKEGVYFGKLSGPKSRMFFVCKKGHGWSAKAGSLIYAKTWCRECSKSGSGIRVTQKRVEDVALHLNGELIAGTVENQKSQVEIKCDKGHLWRTSVFSLLYKNTWCPECAGKAGEAYAIKHIRKTTGLSFKKVRPHWLMGLNGKPLELDAFCEEKSFAIEYQGQQHYQFLPMWHKTEACFTEGQERDALKRVLCAQHGVMLFEIPYILKPTPERVAKHVESEAQKACLPFMINPDYRDSLLE